MESPQTLYNFNVEGNHNYYVGENGGVLVHNASCANNIGNAVGQKIIKAVAGTAAIGGTAVIGTVVIEKVVGVLSDTVAIPVPNTRVVTEKAPALTIRGVKYATRSMTKEERLKLPKTNYYLAFADPTNGKVYISIKKISPSLADFIMSTPIVEKCIADANYQMVASVYTMFENNAQMVMDRVGYNPITPRGKPHPPGREDDEYQMYHYHSNREIFIRTPGSPEGNLFAPHMFFDEFFPTV